jgi:hypothetical protein
MSEHKTIAAAICAVMLDCKGIKETGYNKHANYKYASDADILRVVQPSMAQHGLALTIDDIDIEHKTLGGKMSQWCVAKVTYRLTHTSGEHLTVVAIGSGADNVDKGPYKALTGALKYALRAIFLLPTGQDPDQWGGNDNPPPQRQPPAEHHPSWTDDERRGFMGALSRLGLDYEKQVKPFCVAQDWGKPSTWPSEQRRQFVNDIESGKVQIS